MNKKLEGKVAVVTGGSRDLGRAVSIKLAREGAKVCVNYRGSEEDALETLRLIKAEGGEAIIVKGDMTKAADVKNLFEKTKEAFGPVVHVLVNVVGGIMGRKTVTEQDEDWYNLLIPKINRIEELVKYCEQIAAAAPSMPFYYYHIPAFNGAFLPMLDLLKAVDGRIPNFAGIKYTFESLYEYNQCRLYKDGKYDMLHGQDETILPSLAQGGAQGGIGGTTNYNGRELVGIIDAWKRGDLETAREKQNFSQAVINVICHYRGNIVGGKRIMKLIGFDLGPNRVPFQNMTDEEEIAMRKELESVGFFERCNVF